MTELTALGYLAGSGVSANKRRAHIYLEKTPAGSGGGWNMFCKVDLRSLVFCVYGILLRIMSFVTLGSRVSEK